MMRTAFEAEPLNLQGGLRRCPGSATGPGSGTARTRAKAMTRNRAQAAHESVHDLVHTARDRGRSGVGRERPVVTSQAGRTMQVAAHHESGFRFQPWPYLARSSSERLANLAPQ